MAALDELRGLVDELDSCITRGKKERADQVRVALRAKRSELQAEAERLEREARVHVDAGQGLLAERKLTQARALSAGLESLTPVETRDEAAPKRAGRATSNG